MGTVGIAYDQADEATAKAVASRLERLGEDVKLIMSSDKLNGFDRVIILWSRASLHSPQLHDIWRLFVRTQHAMIGDVSPDELPEQVSPDLLFVITKDHELLESSRQRPSLMSWDLCWVGVGFLLTIAALLLVVLAGGLVCEFLVEYEVVLGCSNGSDLQLLAIISALISLPWSVATLLIYFSSVGPFWEALVGTLVVIAGIFVNAYLLARSCRSSEWRRGVWFGIWVGLVFILPDVLLNFFLTP